MRLSYFAMVLTVLASVVGNWAFSQERPSAERVSGMKAAVSDLEQGVLRQKLAYPFAPPIWIAEYVELAKKQKGIVVDISRDVSAEDAGYNDVMRAEIVHRFGPNALADLAKAAETEHQRRKQ